MVRPCLVSHKPKRRNPMVKIAFIVAAAVSVLTTCPLTAFAKA
jgi:hypothetical protein